METQPVFSEIGTESLSVFLMIYRFKIFSKNPSIYNCFLCCLFHFFQEIVFRVQKDISWVIISRSMRWVGYVARMGRRGAYKGDWCENLREREHLVYLGVCGRIVLKWVFNK